MPVHSLPKMPSSIGVLVIENLTPRFAPKNELAWEKFFATRSNG